jgi:Glycosyl transferase family 2
VINGRVDVVIPTFNNRAELEECLEALAAQGNDVRAIVCVDGSIDGTRTYLASTTWSFDTVILEHPDRKNHGLAAARNLALPHLEATYVLFLDSDMVLAPHAIDRHLDLVTSRQCISVGKTTYLNASTNLWSRYVASRGKDKSGPGTEMSALYFNAENAMMPSRLILAVQGFDEAFKTYGLEDTELGLRLGATGVPMIFNADAMASTVETRSVAEGLALLHELGRVNLPKVREKHPDAPAPFRIDQLESPRLRDRAFRSLMNPASDLLARLMLPVAPWTIQRRLIAYLAIRAVWRGYSEAIH